MVRGVFEISFTSEVYKVRQIVLDILSFVNSELQLSDADNGDLRLIFSELIINAVIHGNKQDINKTVNIRIEISDYSINATISDEGIGFDHFNLLKKFDLDENLNNENGRGIRLVYSLTDSMAYNIRGNEIQFYKRVATNG